MSATVLVFSCAAAGTEIPGSQSLVAGDSFDFGSVRQGARLTHAFLIPHVAATPPQVTGATLSMPGMSVRVTPSSRAGDTVATVEWNTERVSGAIEGEVLIHWSDPQRAATSLKLKGRVIAPVSFEPMPALFLSAFTSESAEQVLTIRNNEAAPLGITRVEHSNHLHVAVIEVEPGKVFTLRTRSAPGVAAGRYEETLTLVTEGTPARRIALPVHLWVKPELYANPDALDFGVVRLEDVRTGNSGDALTQTALLKRRGGRPFEVKAIDCDLASVEVLPAPGTPQDGYQIVVRLRPESLRRGDIQGKVRLLTNDAASSEIVVPLMGRII